MEEQRKGDWIFIESKSLGQKIAFDKKSGWVVCQDKTCYNPSEVSLITKCGELPVAVHLAKKIFGGEIISADCENTSLEAEQKEQKK